MSALHEASQLALEALEYGQHSLKQISEYQWESRGQLAMDALKAALDRQPEPAQEPVGDPFTDIRDKRMGELNAEQTDRATELWLREQIGPREDYWYPHLQALFRIIDRLRAHPEPAPTVEFDHGIGADRFKVVRGSYWWHILIGDSPIKRGKFHTQAGAEEMVALLLREFRNGAFVQHNTAPPQQPEPAQEPSESSCDECGKSKADGWALYCVECLEQFFHPTEPAQEPVGIVRIDSGEVHIVPTTRDADVSPLRDGQAVYATPQPQRPPLTYEEIAEVYLEWGAVPGRGMAEFARAIERKVRGEA